MANKRDMWCVEYHCPEGKLQHIYHPTEEEALAHAEVVKPIAFFGPQTVDVYEVQLTMMTESTTDFVRYQEAPWEHDWGRMVWWDGVSNPEHLRKLND